MFSFWRVSIPTHCLAFDNWFGSHSIFCFFSSNQSSSFFKTSSERRQSPNKLFQGDTLSPNKVKLYIDRKAGGGSLFHFISIPLVIADFEQDRQDLNPGTTKRAEKCFSLDLFFWVKTSTELYLYLNILRNWITIYVKLLQRRKYVFCQTPAPAKKFALFYPI